MAETAFNRSPAPLPSAASQVGTYVFQHLVNQFLAKLRKLAFQCLGNRSLDDLLDWGVLCHFCLTAWAGAHSFPDYCAAKS